jgi:CMP/dCMP kinase
MSYETHIVTIDGHRGTGKTKLATGLRDYFGCGVLEIGPIFRLLSWLVAEKQAQDGTEACTFLTKALATGSILIDPYNAGDLASCQIVVDGRRLDQELWSPTLDVILRIVAESQPTIDCVGGIIRRLAGNNKMIVVGREAGSRMFPNAHLKLVLYASDESRRQRKLSQLTENVQDISTRYDIEDSEPRARWSYTGKEFVLNTTAVSPGEVLEQAISHVCEQLGWSKATKLPIEG